MWWRCGRAVSAGRRAGGGRGGGCGGAGRAGEGLGGGAGRTGRTGGIGGISGIGGAGAGLGSGSRGRSGGRWGDRSGGECGQAHGEHGPSGDALHAHRAVVRRRDGLHDGEPEPGRSGGPRPGRVPSGEPLEDVRQQRARDSRTVVLDVHAQPRPLPAHPRGDGRTGRGVALGVGQQVDQDLLEPGGVRGDRGGFVGQGEPPVVVTAGRAGVADGVHDERDQIGRGELQRPAGVQAGEQQQVLHQQGHPCGLGLDPPEGVPGVGTDLFVAAPGQLGVAADGGERGAQFMAGVGDEPPYPRLALLPRLQCAVDVVEHPVQRGADLSDLGVRIALGVRDAFAEVHLAGVQRQFGDAGGGGGDPAQRAGGHADDDGSGEAGGEQSGGGDTDLDEDQGVDDAVGVLGRDAHVEGAVGSGDVLGAVAAEAGEAEGVRAAVGGHAAEGGELGPVQVLGARVRRGPRLAAHLALGGGAVAHLGHDRVLRLRAERDELVQFDAPGRLRAAGRAGSPVLSRRGEGAGGALADLVQPAVELVVQMRAQGQGGHRADHRADDGDEHDGDDDEAGAQGAVRAGGAGRPEGTGHHTAGLIRYPAPRRVWIIGSRPASIFRRR